VLQRNVIKQPERRTEMADIEFPRSAAGYTLYDDKTNEIDNAHLN
jgi:hypothetical protein